MSLLHRSHSHEPSREEYLGGFGKPGVRSRIKRQVRRRERAQARQATRRHEQED